MSKDEITGAAGQDGAYVDVTVLAGAGAQASNAAANANGGQADAGRVADRAESEDDAAVPDIEEVLKGPGPLGLEVMKGNKVVKLSDGRTAVIRKGKGRDLREAMRRGKGDLTGIQFELVAVLTVIDGKPVFSDELLDMDLDDVMALMGGMGGDTPDFTRKIGTSST